MLLAPSPEDGENMGGNGEDGHKTFVWNSRRKKKKGKFVKLMPFVLPCGMEPKEKR